MFMGFGMGGKYVLDSPHLFFATSGRTKRRKHDFRFFSILDLGLKNKIYVLGTSQKINS